ncbi:MAG: helix-turn-helix transcriptional regulator [Flavobacteriales bacterium]|nr:helix-turn-helix transcriptional regulator [Flavobacteriales bacterium]
MNERVIQLIALLGESKSSFAARIGVSAAVISHISNGRNKVGAEVVEKIAQNFPQVSLSWLFTGEGSPFVKMAGPDIPALLAETEALIGQMREIEGVLKVMQRRVTVIRSLLKNESMDL